MPSPETRRSSDGQTQEAVGGWWKMRKWWYRSMGPGKGKGNNEDSGNAWCILGMGAAFERCITRIEGTGDGPSQGSLSCIYPYP